MDYFIPVYVSAKTGQRVDKIIKTVDEVYANASFRPTTGVLNDVIRDAYAVNEPPSFKGRRLKIYFVSATDTNPPVIVFSVNDAELVHFSYRRYLENTLRKTFNFKGTPIKLVFSNKNED